MSVPRPSRNFAGSVSRFFSSIVSHYVSDGHVPFHAALNYDGQLTGQTGIHSRFEAELFDVGRVEAQAFAGGADLPPI